MNVKNGVTIQINSLAALERLLGNDPELEINLRNSVVQNYANKYIRGIAETFENSAAFKDLRKQMNDNIREKFLVKDGHVHSFGKQGFGLNDETKKLVDEYCTDELKSLVCEKYDAQRVDVSEIIERKVKAISDNIENYITESAFQYKVTQEVNRRLKLALDNK